MGQGDEYSRDAYNYDLAPDSDTDSDDVDLELHPEDWQDMYSQELLDGWMVMKDYLDENYVQIYGTFPKFVELVLDPTRWYTNDEPYEQWVILWNLIARLPIISDRVQPQNFYAWAENYIGYF